jgi:hypothetical protein
MSTRNPAAPEDADRERIFAHLDASCAVDFEGVVSALEEAGLPFKQREDGWVVPASVHLPCEVAVRPLPGGVRVESVLLAWDELGETELSALQWFSSRAERGLRFARCELAGRQVRVAAQVRADEVERILPHAVLGVATGVRLLAREAGTLLLPEVARAYLEFVAL